MKRPNHRRRSTRRFGFTIIEMATVTAIISSIPAGAYVNAKKKAYQTECLNNQRQTATMLQMHMMDSDAFPEAAFYPADINADNSILQILKEQGATPRSMICPGLPEALQQKKLNFVYNDALGGKRAPGDATTTWVLTEFSSVSLKAPAPHTNGWNVLFADGHVDTTAQPPQDILNKRAEAEKAMQ